MAVFFPSLLPQFVQGDATFLGLLLLGLIFSAMTFAWLCAYALGVRLAGDFLRRSIVRRAFDGLTGIVLVGFGLRIAAEHR
jgi:threonine/homoserine/homoserine lactone efflux protein